MNWRFGEASDRHLDTGTICWSDPADLLDRRTRLGGSGMAPGRHDGSRGNQRQVKGGEVDA